MKLVKGNVFSDAIFYSLGRILPQVIAFIFLPIFTFHLAVSEYGIVNSMQAMGPILIVIFTFGLDRGVLRIYYENETEFEKRSYLFTISLAIFLISSISIIILFIFNNYVNAIFPSIKFFPYFSYSILSIYLNSFSLIPLIYLQIKRKPIKYCLLSFGQFIIGITLSFYLVVYKREGAIGMIIGPFYASLLLLPLYIIIIFKASIIKINIHKFWNTFKFALPMIPHLLCAWVINFSDRVFIESYHNQFDIGIYSLGAKVNSIIIVTFGAFMTAYSPYFYEIANGQKEDQAKSTLSVYNNLIIGFFIICIFAILFFSEDILTIFFKKDYLLSMSVINILCFSSFFSIFLGLSNLMYYQSKATLPLMYIYTIGALINLLLNHLLVIKYSYIGASYATAGSFLIMFILQLSYSKKYFYIKFLWKKILFLMTFLAIIYSMYITFIPVDFFISTIFKIFILILIFSGYLFINYKLFNRNNKI